MEDSRAASDRCLVFLPVLLFRVFRHLTLRRSRVPFFRVVVVRGVLVVQTRPAMNRRGTFTGDNGEKGEVPSASGRDVKQGRSH